MASAPLMPRQQTATMARTDSPRSPHPPSTHGYVVLGRVDICSCRAPPDATPCRDGDARDLPLHAVRHSGFGRDDGDDGDEGGALGSAESHRASSAVDGGARGRVAPQPWRSPGSCSVWSSSTVSRLVRMSRNAVTASHRSTASLSSTVRPPPPPSPAWSGTR